MDKTGGTEPSGGRIFRLRDWRILGWSELIQLEPTGSKAAHNDADLGAGNMLTCQLTHLCQLITI